MAVAEEELQVVLLVLVVQEVAVPLLMEASEGLRTLVAVAVLAKAQAVTGPRALSSSDTTRD